MQEEHDVFTSVLKRFVGNDNVIEVEQLLYEALQADEAARDEIDAIQMALSGSKRKRRQTTKALMGYYGI